MTDKTIDVSDEQIISAYESAMNQELRPQDKASVLKVVRATLLALKPQQAAPISNRDLILLEQAHDMLLAHADDQRTKGNDAEALGAKCSADAVLRLGAAASAASRGVEQQAAQGEPQWVVNDLGELGVSFGSRFFFLYKGDNIEYGVAGVGDAAGGAALHDDGTPMRYRIVGKSEFGETCLPLKWVASGKREPRYTEGLAYYPGLSFGTPKDGEWRDLPTPTPPAPSVQGEPVIDCSSRTIYDPYRSLEQAAPDMRRALFELVDAVMRYPDLAKNIESTVRNDAYAVVFNLQRCGWMNGARQTPDFYELESNLQKSKPDTPPAPPVQAVTAHAQVPEGWQLVPVEPTPKMVDSTWNEGLDIIESHNTRNKRIYSAMLSASPNPPEPPEQAPQAVGQAAAYYLELRDGQGWPAVFLRHDAPEPLRGADLDAAMEAILARSEKGGAL